MFGVRDFVGNMCSVMASRIRGAVANTNFDEFHKQSARIIRKSIFGIDSDGKINDEFRFVANSLVVTNVDIEGLAPVDQHTRENLQKSVTLAIDITS